MYFDTLWIFVFEKPHFHSIYYNSPTNCCIILHFFQDKQTAFVNILSPHTLFLLTRSLAVHAVTSSNFVISAPVESRDRVEMTNPKTADICKRRRVKGLEIILIEKGINFI